MRPPLIDDDQLGRPDAIQARGRADQVVGSEKTVAEPVGKHAAEFDRTLRGRQTRAIGFDSINGEFNRRTLSRLLAQPIYRDALLLGKFLAGLVALAILWPDG